MTIVVVVHIFLAISTFFGLKSIDLVLSVLGGSIWAALGYRPVKEAQEHLGKARSLEATLPAVYAVEQQEEIKESLLKLIETTITISID